MKIQCSECTLYRYITTSDGICDDCRANALLAKAFGGIPQDIPDFPYYLKLDANGSPVQS